MQAVWEVSPAPDAGKRRARRGARAVAKGADGFVSVRRFGSARACVDALGEARLPIWVTALPDVGDDGGGEGALTALERPLAPPPALALVVGSESHGVSEELRAAAERLVTLPMFGLVESLNVHTATAVRERALFRGRARRPRSHPTRARSSAYSACSI